MILDDIASYLETQAVGTVGTDIFKGILPEEPGDIISLWESGEAGDSLLHAGVDVQTITFVIRAETYSSARSKAESVKNMLHGISEVTPVSTRIILMKANGPPSLLGYDLNRRAEFRLEFRTIYES